jgi:predicted secreted Zn-dependent protease
MRSLAVVLALALLAYLPLAKSAFAKVKVSEKTEYYEISGKTGVDLYRDMGRRGPRHGFLTKAIAQTRYEVTPEGHMAHEKGLCRIKGAGVTLKITYIYPKPRGPLSADLARRWKRFQADNVRHEQMHGRIAKEFAAAADTYFRRFAVKDGPSCRKAVSQLKREAKALTDRYEKKQVDFDRNEHRDGGAVDKSALALIGKR